MSSVPASLEVGVAGLYKFEAFRADDAGNEVPGSRRVVADWFPNLITNLGLNSLMANTGTDRIPYCYVGSGSTPPAVTDTALVAQVATTDTIQASTSGSSTVAPYYGWRRVVYRFAAGVAAGNLSEVGVGTSSSSSLFSRALIVDGNGNPTTITVLPDEVLDVTYEIRIYVPTDDAVYTINSGGVDYTFTVRAALAGTSNWDGFAIGRGLDRFNFNAYPATSVIGAITGQPSGANAQFYSFTNMWTATASNLSNTFRISLGLNNANATGGIGAFTIGLASTYGGGICMLFQVQCSPVLPKDGTKTMTMDFTLSLARVNP